MNKIKQIRISDWYYILVALGYVATLVFGGMRPGVFGAALMVLAVAELIWRRELKADDMRDWIAIAYFLYQLISVIWLFRGGFPVGVFVNEFVSSTLPMVFYFVGKSTCDPRRWYRNYLYAMLLLGILGVTMYIAAPQFYINWAYEWSYISKADVPTMRVRMHSVVGSTCLSFIMVAGMLAASYFLDDHNDPVKKDPAVPDTAVRNRRKDMIFAVCTMAACLLFAIMANQRSGLVAAAFVLVYVNYLLFFHLDLIPKKYFLYEIIALAAIFTGICIVKFEFILKFWYRIISLPTAVSQRRMGCRREQHVQFMDRKRSRSERPQSHRNRGCSRDRGRRTCKALLRKRGNRIFNVCVSSDPDAEEWYKGYQEIVCRDRDDRCRAASVHRLQYAGVSDMRTDILVCCRKMLRQKE